MRSFLLALFQLIGGIFPRINRPCLERLCGSVILTFRMNMKCPDQSLCFGGRGRLWWRLGLGAILTDALSRGEHDDAVAFELLLARLKVRNGNAVASFLLVEAIAESETRRAREIKENERKREEKVPRLSREAGRPNINVGNNARCRNSQN